jgi:hypothetical protein
VRFKYALPLWASILIVAFLIAILIFSEKTLPVKNFDNPKRDEKKSSGFISSWETKKITDNQNIVNNADSLVTIQDEVQVLPVEWEEPFLEIMTKPDQSMDQRNSLLIDFAINKAVGVDAVQEECLMHLAYGLRSNQKDEFDKIITTPNIPIEIRKRFLGHLFDMNRSDDFITWLCGQVRILGNAELISFCRSRVQNFDEL